MKKKEKIFKTIKKRISNSRIVIEIFAFFGALLIKIYSLTLRVKIEIDEDVLKLINKKKVFFTGFWEGRQILFVPYFAKYKMCVLIDDSWIGKILSRVLHYFGYKTVSGSVKRKSVSATIGLKKMAEKGYILAFSLDGPRGPAYKSKPGIIFLAKKLNVPVVPSATTAKNKWILEKTWCKYMLPKPFSRCLICLGKPLDIEKEDIDNKKLDEIINSFTEQTDNKLKNLFG